MTHQCTRALKGEGGRVVNIECSCAWVESVYAANPHDALVKAINRFADHAVVQAGTDG